MRIHFTIALATIASPASVNGGSVKVHSPLGPCSDFWALAGFPEKDQSDPVCEPGETPSEAGPLDAAQKALFLATKYPDSSRTVDDLISHIWGANHANHPYARMFVETVLKQTAEIDDYSRGKTIRRAFATIDELDQVISKHGHCKEWKSVQSSYCASCPRCTGDLNSDSVYLSDDVLPYIFKFFRKSSDPKISLRIPYMLVDADAGFMIPELFNAAWITYQLSSDLYDPDTGKLYKSVLRELGDDMDALFKSVGYSDAQLGTARARYKQLRAQAEQFGPEAMIAWLACDSYFVHISGFVSNTSRWNPICSSMGSYIVKEDDSESSGEVV